MFLNLINNNNRKSVVRIIFLLLKQIFADLMRASRPQLQHEFKFFF